MVKEDARSPMMVTGWSQGQRDMSSQVGGVVSCEEAELGLCRWEWSITWSGAGRRGHAVETDPEPPGVPSHNSGNPAERQVQEGPARGPGRGGLSSGGHQEH